MIKKCIYCKSDFDTGRDGKRRKYCNQNCYREFKKENGYKGIFKKGKIPWNKGLKGIHLSPNSEFKKGDKPVNWVSVGTIKERYRKRDKKIRKFIKIAEPNVWEENAKYVWKLKYKKIIRGDIIHHLNGVSNDDRKENLIALPRKDHPIFHNRWGIKPLTEEQIKFYKSRYNSKSL